MGTVTVALLWVIAHFPFKRAPTRLDKPSPGGPNMNVVTTITEKGGVGKTTLCAYLIWYALDNGRRVLAIDLDQQANLTHTLGDSHSQSTTLDLFVPDMAIDPVGQLTVVPSGKEALDIEQTRDEAIPLAFRDNVLRAAQHFDLCVIDTPPSLGVRAVAALITSDATVAPIDLGEYSVLGVGRVLEFQQQVAALYQMPPPRFLGLIPCRYNRRSPRERAIFEQLVAAGGEIPLFPYQMSQRDAFARSASERVPSWQMQGTAAREASAEVKPLLDELTRRLTGVT